MVLTAAITVLTACGVGAHPTEPVGSPTAANPSTGCRVPQPILAAHPDAATAARATAALSAYAALAWNASAPPVRPSTLSGGLFINFRPSWNGSNNVAANTNIQTSGESDAQGGRSPRHDPLTDLTVLRAVDTAFSMGADDEKLTALRCRLQPVAEAEFTNYGVERGWVYDQLIDLAELDPSGPWRTDARAFAGTLARRFAGGLNSRQTFRPDWVAESAAALTDAGNRFEQPGWASIGGDLARRLCQTSADPTTGLFPARAHLVAGGRAMVDDAIVKVGSQAQLLDALLTVYEANHDKLLLAAVRRALDSLRSPAIGVEDTVNGGWFYAVNVDGSSVRKSYKETRQAWLVNLFRHAAANGLVPTDLSAQMLTIVRDKLYQTESLGYVYRVRADWTAFASLQNRKPVEENWVSSEATGIATQALLGPLS
jgi:hypothetical protein